VQRHLGRGGGQGKGSLASPIADLFPLSTSLEVPAYILVGGRY